MIFLAYGCQLAGFVVIIGAFWLLFKQKIYLDAKTKEVMYVELPFVGKIKTNTPSLALFVFGLVAIGFPYYLSRTRYVNVHQHFSSNAYPIAAYAVSHQNSVGEDGELNLKVPWLPDSDYTPMIVFRDGPVTQQETIELSKAKGDKLDLGQSEIFVPQNNLTSPTVDVAPKPQGFK